MKRLTDAVRDLRAAQLRAADPEQARRLGEAFKVMRDRAEAAGIGLERLKEQYESLGPLGRALADFRAEVAHVIEPLKGFRDATLGVRAAMLATAAVRAAPLAGAAVGAAGALPAQAIQGLAAAAGGAVGAVTGLGRAVGAFVEASNPAEMIRFNIAVKDLMASFGRVFEPVISVLIEFANLVNQFVTSLQPVVGPIVRQLADAFLQIAKAVLDAVAPVVETLVPVFKLLADVVLPPIVAVFRVLSDAVREVVNWFRSLTGQEPLGRASEAGGTRTVAAQRAATIGVSQIGEQARASAFGAATTTEILRRNNELTERGNSVLESIRDWLSENVGRAAERVGRDAIEAIGGLLS